MSVAHEARHKPAILLNSAPTKQVLPQGQLNIVNNLQATMRGKKNRLVNQEGRESYGDEAAEDAKAISQGNNEFVGANNKFEAARAEESTEKVRS